MGGEEAAMRLASYAEELMLATGDAVRWSPTKRGKKKQFCKIFGQVGKDVAACIEAVEKVEYPPRPRRKKLKGKYSFPKEPMAVRKKREKEEREKEEAEME